MRIKKTSNTRALAGKVVNENSESTTDTYSCNFINNLKSSAIIVGKTNITSVEITSSTGYGNVWILGTNFISKIGLSGTNQTPNIFDAVGTHPFNVSVSGNTVVVSSLGNWDHYIFIGTNNIASIN